MIPIFVAIDTTSYPDAQDLLYKLGDHVQLKLGLEFFTANGPEFCRELRDKGATKPRELFLDLKFHDIPNTVAGAVRAAMEIEPDYLTLHTCEGVEPLQAAVKVADKHIGKRPKLLGVTVLTSNENDDGFATRLGFSRKAGLDGIICPPSWIKWYRGSYQDNLFLMVPGIRMEGDKNHDQKNVTTPRQAMIDGASAIVVGRSITQAKDPLKAVLAIKESMEENA